MFFNKLKEELKEYLTAKLTKFAKRYTIDIIKGININHTTIEELIAKYRHIKWKELTPFEAEVLVDRFHLQNLCEGMGIYRGPKTTFAPYYYVSNTLTKVKEKIDKYKLNDIYEGTTKIEDSKRYTPPSKEKIALAKIKAIVNNQKSTVKAVKAINEVLKEAE
ncbi:hypothetical protein IJ425_04090 [bacterium]|nr:hypothetical protein [bacterium]